MLKALGYRLLVKPDDFNSEHEVKGTDIVLEIVHNEREKKATMTTGVILDIGPLASCILDMVAKGLKILRLEKK